MDNLKIAKQLVKLARSIVSNKDTDQNTWQVWSIDCWGNQEDGWDFNDRCRIWTFQCESDQETDIQNCFEQSLKEHGCKVVPFEYDWYDEKECQVNNSQTGKYLWQINKEFGR